MFGINVKLYVLINGDGAIQHLTTSNWLVNYESTFWMIFNQITKRPNSSEPKDQLNENDSTLKTNQNKTKYLESRTKEQQYMRKPKENKKNVKRRQLWFN